MMETQLSRRKAAPFPARTLIVSLILKCAVILSAVIGVVMSANAGRRSFMGGNRVFMYFTIQSNIAIALICLIGAALMLAGARIGNGWYAAKFVGTVAITLTGVVFCFVLAPTMSGNAWSLPNVLTHVVVPLAAVLDFFLTGVYGHIRRKSVFLVILPPLAYAVYAGIGYAAGWEFADGIRYPYFFLNWGSPAGAFGFTEGLPYMGCVWWILAIFLFLMAVGLLYLAVLDRLRKRVGPSPAKCRKDVSAK